MADLNVAVKIAGADVGAGGVLSGIIHALDGVTSAAGRAGSAGVGLGANLAKIGLGVFGIKQIASAVGSVAVGMVSGHAAMETYSTQLATLMGGADKAKDRLAELARFGAETPFELPEVVRAEKVLLGFGLTGQKALDLTSKSGSELRTIIGDVAAGTGASFEEIALNFGKFSAGATGEAISRFQEMGVVTREQLAAMGIEFSKSGELISPLPKAMQAAVAIAQQKFGGGMAALSKTFSGQMSTLADNFNQAKNVLTAPIFDALKDGVGALNDALSGQGFQGVLQSVAETLGGVVKRGVDGARVAFGLLMDIIHDGGDLGAFSDSFRDLFGIDITPLVSLQRWLGDVLPGALATLRDGLQQTYERATTFFGSLASGETLATSVNRAFGDLIPPGLNATLDAVDEAFGRVKVSVLALADAARTGGASGALDELAEQLRSAGATETVGAFEQGMGSASRVMDTLGEAARRLAAGLAVAFTSSGQSAVDWGRVIDTTVAGVVRALYLPLDGFNTLVTASQSFQAAQVAVGEAVVSSVQTTSAVIVATTAASWAQVTGTVQRATASVLATVSGAWNGVLGITDASGVTLRDAISSNWSAVIGNTQAAWQTVRDTVASSLGSAESVVRSALDSISSQVSTKWGEATGATSRAWESIASTVNGALNGAGGVVSLVASAFGSVTSTISSALDATSGAQAIVSTALSGISGLLRGSDVGSAAASFGGDIVDGIIGALGSLGSGLMNAISAAIQSIRVTVGMFTITAYGVTVKWPTISPPTISGGNTAASVAAYAAGTDYARGGLALVGEAGPELVDLPRGSRVWANDRLGGLLGGMGATIDYARLGQEVAAALEPVLERTQRPSYQLQYTGGTSSEATPRDLERMFSRMEAFA